MAKRGRTEIGIIRADLEYIDEICDVEFAERMHQLSNDYRFTSLKCYFEKGNNR